MSLFFKFYFLKEKIETDIKRYWALGVVLWNKQPFWTWSIDQVCHGASQRRFFQGIWS